MDWFADAQPQEINDAGAMALATYDQKHKRLSNRMVFLRGVDRTGFLFFTHLESPKSLDLQTHPNAAITFHWKSLRRQVRVEGEAVSASDEAVGSFFASRQDKAKLDIWASKQSQKLPSREHLLEERASLVPPVDLGSLPKPSHWCGYRLVPDRMEFWRSDREAMHDRFVFQLEKQGWVRSLLYP